jgi:D-alanyl-D-alanine carboxypeptidase
MLAVLASLPFAIFGESLPSEISPSMVIGQTFNQAAASQWTAITAKLKETISAIMDGSRDVIGQQSVDPKTKAIVQTHLDQYLKEIEKQLQGNSSLLVLLHSETLGISYEYPPNGSEAAFQIASIGKVFTATLICMLADRGKIYLDDPIVNYLPETSLKGLFVFEGRDYAKQVTVRQLLTHTSGVADYAEDPVINGPAFFELLLEDPDTFWTPEMLLSISRDNQHPVGKPGDIFHYSDTGYILLGRIIENITDKPFHENLHEEFFNPLGMDDSYLMFRSEPANQPKKPIQKIWLGDREISKFTSLSSDWAAGGIVSTPADLLKFHRALREGKLISPALLGQMETYDGQFLPGINYGMGMMQINFPDSDPMLRSFSPVTGHLGIWATHMLYDRTTDSHIILNLGSTSCMNTSFEVLIEVMKTIANTQK